MRGWLTGLLAILIAVVCASPEARALDTTKQLPQYGETTWRIRDGAFAGTPYAIAQTTDGYLWIGTQVGLLRFDGVRFVAWRAPNDNASESSRITALLGARDGSLWIGTGTGLSRLQSGALANIADAIGPVMAILEDSAGTIWIARGYPDDAKGALCRVSGSALECYGEAERIPLQYAVTLASDQRGGIWLGGGAMVVRRQGTASETFRSAIMNSNEVVNGVSALASGRDGSMWVGQFPSGRGGGLQKLVDGSWRPFIIPNFDGSRLEVTKLLVDRDSNLWIGTLNDGVYRVQASRIDHFHSSDGLSSDLVTGLFQDHEGNIWVATIGGIDKIREVDVANVSTRQGLSADFVNSVVASRDGTVWVGNQNLDALRTGGAVTSIEPTNGLPGHQVTSLLEDRAGRLWVGIDRELSVYDKGTFTRISSRNCRPFGSVVAIAEDVDGNIWVETRYINQHQLLRIRDLIACEKISVPELPLVNVIAADPNGGVWLGLASGGLARFLNGRVEFFPLNRTRDDPVHGLLVRPDGSVLAATASGLVQWRSGSVRRLNTSNGLPCDAVLALIPDSQSDLWLNTRCGLIAIQQAELERAWHSPDLAVKFKLVDVGWAPSNGSMPFQPNASRSPDGRLWFVSSSGLQMINPGRLTRNPTPPPVHIEEIVADRTRYAPGAGLRFPALTRDIEIDYTALSFVAPQKVRFRIRLEGRDPDWQDPGTRRAAFYADLRPGTYRFRVIAANNDAVWNEEGATLDFIVAAAWYQTLWFRVSIGAGFLLLLSALYQLRVHQLRRQEWQLRDVIDTVPAMAFAASPDGANQWANRRWMEYSGLSRDDTAGSGWRSMVHPDNVEDQVRKWTQSVASGDPFENEIRLRSAVGEYRWFLMRAVPMRDPSGTIRKWYGTLTDIEDRIKAERERERVRQLQADLEHVNRLSLMGELATSLSHELQQPITATITDANTCVRWLKRNQPDLSEACEAATRAVRAANRAAAIISRLRSFYKKGAPAEREPLDVNDVAREVISLLRSEAKQSRVSIRTDLGHDLPSVRGDRIQLQQVCLNLMLNAIEAMKETGGGELTITSTNNNDALVVISVSDTGVGLPAGQEDQIFNAFFTTKPDGSGMGLSISRSIIESHGGRLWATANVERGATIHFTVHTG